MKKIVQGNDFRMRIPVFRIVNGEQVPFPLPASEHIHVRLCGEYRRVELEHEIDVTNDNVLVAKVDGRSVSCGCYGIEVRGVMFGQDWRSCEYEQIRIVHNNAEADTEFDYSEGEPSVEMDTALVILAADPDFYTKVEQAEQARVAAENLRVDAENNRALAEGARSDMEVMREEAEAERIANEELRQTAETERAEAEAARITNEDARVTNENLRKTSEAARASAETNRDSAESLREANEAQRKADENARASAEAERVEIENTRKANETNRVAAEEIRITAEQNREIAEAQREANEEKRQEFFASVSKDMFVPVAQLPTEDIDPKTVYLLKDSSGKNGNLYSEYIYTDGAWEKIGSASVDIDGLLKEEDIATVNGQKLTNGGNILISAETIVLDAEPTKGSVNGVTSGGVYPLREHQACFKSALPLLRAILKKGLYTEDVTDDIDSLIELLAKGTPDDVARPIITIDENNYVHITCEDKDASIYYSLYGDDAKRGSLFTEPFSMQWNCTIKAVAVLDDKSSPVAEKTYKAIENEYIEFADPLLAKLAIMPTTETFTAEDGTQYNGFGWDKDGDGRVSKKDAAAVTSVWLNSNKGVKNFEEFVFFEGIKSMTGYDLFGCACDTIITPPSLKIISNHVFTQADTRKLIISEGCETLGGLTYVSLEYLSLPQSLKTLGTISHCGTTVGLNVTIPASVESLPQLYNCVLNEVKIIGNYTSMRSDAFQFSRSLSGVTVKIMLASENVMVLSEAFKDFGISTATFYVRDELLEQYKVAEFWSAHYDAGRIKGISEW